MSTVRAPPPSRSASNTFDTVLSIDHRVDRGACGMELSVAAVGWLGGGFESDENGRASGVRAR